MRLQILLAIALSFSACERRRVVATSGSTAKIHDTSATVTDTAFESTLSASKEMGRLVMDNETFNIVMTYTDDVAYSQKVGNNNEGVLLYRDAFVSLISKDNDTIKIRKSDFKKYIPHEAYEQMILQGAGSNVGRRSGHVPFMVWLCQPDTDYCFEFEVTVSGGKVTAIKELPEEEIGDED